MLGTNPKIMIIIRELRRINLRLNALSKTQEEDIELLDKIAELIANRYIKK